MSGHEDLIKRIRFAINDPGAFVKRKLDEHGGGAESVGEWGARAVLAALVQSDRSPCGSSPTGCPPVPYVFLRDWLKSEIEGWSLRTDMRTCRDPQYHGPTDLANQIVAGVLPMLVRRDVALETAHALLQRQAKTLAALRVEHRAAHSQDCPGAGDCPGGCGYDGKDKTLYCYTCTDTYAVAIEEQPCPVRRVLDA